jgi:hypothetical protein
MIRPANQLRQAIAVQRKPISTVSSMFVRREKNRSRLKEYVEFMKKYAPNDSPTDFIALSGYINAQTIALGVQRCGDNLTRNSPSDELEQGTCPHVAPWD